MARTKGLKSSITKHTWWISAFYCCCHDRTIAVSNTVLHDDRTRSCCCRNVMPLLPEPLSDIQHKQKQYKDAKDYMQFVASSRDNAEMNQRLAVGCNTLTLVHHRDTASHMDSVVPEVLSGMADLQQDTVCQRLPRQGGSCSSERHGDVVLPSDWQ